MRIKRRKSSKNKFILIFLILTLGISVGYATLSENLNIVGTATTNGKFNVEFSNSKIIDSKGINILNSKAIISEDKKVLTIDIKDMAYPGAGATISCIIKNSGTISAKLKDIQFTGNTDQDINISFLNSEKIGQTLEPNEMWSVKIAVKWNIESTSDDYKKTNFTFSLNFEQDVDEYQPKL